MSLTSAPAACWVLLPAETPLADAIRDRDDVPHFRSAAQAATYATTVKLEHRVLRRLPEVCVVVVCDGCGEAADPLDDTVHFTDATDARRYAEDADWLFIDGAAYCPDCPAPDAPAREAVTHG